MKNFYLISLLLSLFLMTGCGDGRIYTDDQPHKQDDEKRPINTEDIWHHPEYVNMDAEYETNGQLALHVNFTKSVTSDVKHFQIYLDTDNNPNTGFSGGQEHYIIKGADYMIEENKLFKSTSNTKWTWELEPYTLQYKEEKSADGSLKITSSFDTSKITTNIKDTKKINISIEPVNAQWQDTNNFVLTRALTLQ